MKKQSAIFIILGIVLIMGSCINTPPDLYLSFEITSYTDNTTSVSVNYKLTNGGDATLENCKIQFGVDTEAGTGTTYLETNKKWTSGIDLSVGESHTDNISVPYTGTLDSIDVIASGWDDPEDKSAARTVIYYDK